jgi:hypothetical protein
MSEKIEPFVLKYVLPGGATAGYHLDTCCNIGSREDAKVYTTSTPQRQIEIVQKNFRFVWEKNRTTNKTVSGKALPTMKFGS